MSDVDDWFARLEHPLKPIFERVREVLTQAGLEAIVQYGTIQFVYKSPMCSFVQVKDQRQVSLMFNAAGQLQGDFPHLEGNKVKYLRFKQAEDVDADELQALARAWSSYKDKK